jgi:hypothetical protein
VEGCAIGLSKDVGSIELYETHQSLLAQNVLSKANCCQSLPSDVMFDSARALVVGSKVSAALQTGTINDVPLRLREAWLAPLCRPAGVLVSL